MISTSEEILIIRMVFIVLCKLLMGTTDWNWRLVESFIDDSLHERQWADQPSVDGLVVNIMTAFGTRIPHESMYTTCDLTYPERYRTVVIIISTYIEII